MEGMLRDLRYAVRHWLKKPGLVLLIVGTIGLGVGANAAIFSVFEAVLLRPLPFPESDRLVRVYTQFVDQGFDRFWVSAPEYLELQRWNTSFENVGSYTVRASTLGAPEAPLRVRRASISASLFPVLAASPLLGRSFAPEEDLPGGPLALMLSERLWRGSFGADPTILGRSLEVDGRSRTVVGVMPASFDLDDAGIEIFLPQALDPADPGGRGGHYLSVIGRLKPGKSLEVARAELAALLPRWRSEFPDTHVPNAEKHPFYLQYLKEDLIAASRPRMWVLAGAVCLVLLVACANVANLLLARAQGRHREVALRTALGAGRGRLARQFLTEAVLLALVGGVLGLLLALLGVNAILAANPGSVVRVRQIELNPLLLGYTLAVALGTGVLFGLAPALHARARSFFGSLKDGARTAGGRGRLRAGLVVVEVALALMLTVAAGLLLKSFRGLSAVDPGFEPTNVLTFQLSLPRAHYEDAAEVTAFYDRLLDQLRGLPGVSAVGAMSGLPPRREMDANDVEFEGVPKPPDGPIQNVDFFNGVVGDYFTTLKVPLVDGRIFEAIDAASTTPMVVVNQKLAETFWPGQNPVGKRLRIFLSDANPWYTVIGVVGNLKQAGLERPAGTEIFLLNSQLAKVEGESFRTLNLVLKTAGDGLSLASSIRAEVSRLDPGLPVAGLARLGDVVAASTADSRLLTLLLGLFGGLSLVLAAVGTYGVLSFSVEERRHELGVRLALGSGAGELVRLVLARGMGWVGAGVLVGLAGSWFAARVLARVLFQVAPTDPITWSLVVGLLLGVAVLACLLPALRAARVSPVTVLRQSA